jgi:hypothetical protein
MLNKFVRFLTAPWRAWTAYQLAKLQLTVNAQSRPMELMLSMVQEMANAQRAQTAVLQTWLEGFKVTELPSSTHVRDEDEVAAERARHGDDPSGTTLGMSAAEAQALMKSFIDTDYQDFAKP